MLFPLVVKMLAVPSVDNICIVVTKAGAVEGELEGMTNRPSLPPLPVALALNGNQNADVAAIPPEELEPPVVPDELLDVVPPELLLEVVPLELLLDAVPELLDVVPELLEVVPDELLVDDAPDEDEDEDDAAPLLELLAARAGPASSLSLQAARTLENRISPVSCAYRVNVLDLAGQFAVSID